MNEIFEKIYNDNNTDLNESSALFEKVYTEAEMLNEMNPKLRALLAAGLIGTASLGAASCSMPTDDPIIEEEEEHVETAEEKLQRLCNELHVDEATIGMLANAEDYTNIDGLAIDLVDYGLTNLKQYIEESGFEGVTNVADFYMTGKLFLVGDTGYYVPENKVEDFNTAIAAYKAAHAE